MTTSGASIAARAAARSNATGPPAVPSNTRWPAIAIRSRSRVEHGRGAGTGRRLRRGQAARLEDGRVGQPGVAGGARDAAPVRVAAVDRGLDQAGRHDRPRHGPRLGVVPRAGHRGSDERRWRPRRRPPAGGPGRARPPRSRRRATPAAVEPGLDRRGRRRPGRQDEDRVVGARVAVDRELVPGPRRGRPEQAPEHLGRDGRVGQHDRQHRRHPRVDHPDALGDAADADRHRTAVGGRAARRSSSRPWSRESVVRSARRPPRSRRHRSRQGRDQRRETRPRPCRAAAACR